MDGVAAGVQDVVRQAYAAAVGQADWESVMAGLKRVMRSNQVFLLSQAPPHQGGLSAADCEAPELFSRYLAEQEEVDLVLHALQRRPAPPSAGLCWTEAIVPLAALRASRFHAHFLRPVGTAHIGGVVVADGRAGGPPFTGLICHRPSRAGAFAGEDVALLRMLSAGLQQALTVQLRLQAAERAWAEGRVCLRLGPQGEVREASALAVAWLETVPGVWQQGRLRPQDPGERLRLATALLHCARGRPDQAPQWLRLSGPVGHGLLLKLAAVPISPLHDVVANGELVREAQPAAGLGALLTQLYGLTRAEADLACALAQGHTPDTWATQRGVSIGTVRTQLRSAFAKTGSRGQSDLMRLVFSVGR